MVCRFFFVFTLKTFIMREIMHMGNMTNNQSNSAEIVGSHDYIERNILITEINNCYRIIKLFLGYVTVVCMLLTAILLVEGKLKRFHVFPLAHSIVTL